MSYHIRSIDIDSWTVGTYIHSTNIHTYTMGIYEDSECLCKFKRKKTTIIYLKNKKIYFEYCKVCLM